MSESNTVGMEIGPFEFEVEIVTAPDIGTIDEYGNAETLTQVIDEKVYYHDIDVTDFLIKNAPKIYERAIDEAHRLQ